MTLARVVVAVAYLFLGLSFVASTGLLIQEFQGTDWQTLIIAHSHLFFFFPVFGILALAAFYVPSVVFVDLYWRHLPSRRRLSFLAGLALLALCSYGVAHWLDAKPRSIWEVSPNALAADKGDPAGCGSGKTACSRAPILAMLTRLRTEGQARVGLSKFARTCKVDKLLEPPEEMGKVRHCFPADALLSGEDCCKAQERFADEVARLQADPAQRSLSAVYDAVFFLPLKNFFVLLVIAIALMLSVWRDKIDLLYREKIPAVERGVIIGALTMLLWPAMDYGYQQTANVLFGRMESGPQLRLSLVLVPWFLLLLFYFLRRLGKQAEMVGQIAGVVTAGVAVLRFEEFNDWAVRLVGIGSPPWMIGGLLALAFAGFVVLLWPWRSHFAPPPPNSAGS